MVLAASAVGLALGLALASFGLTALCHHVTHHQDLGVVLFGTQFLPQLLGGLGIGNHTLLDELALHVSICTLSYWLQTAVASEVLDISHRGTIHCFHGRVRAISASDLARAEHVVLLAST